MVPGYGLKSQRDKGQSHQNEAALPASLTCSSLRTDSRDFLLQASSKAWEVSWPPSLLRGENSHADLAQSRKATWQRQPDGPSMGLNCLRTHKY
jgi:hypothetical protein